MIFRVSFSCTFYFYFIYLFLNWGIVDLQCRVSFRCTAQWFSFMSVYLHCFSDSFPYRLLQNIEYSSQCLVLFRVVVSACWDFIMIRGHWLGFSDWLCNSLHLTSKTWPSWFSFYLSGPSSSVSLAGSFASPQSWCWASSPSVFSPLISPILMSLNIACMLMTPKFLSLAYLLPWIHLVSCLLNIPTWMPHKHLNMFKTELFLSHASYLLPVFLRLS